MTTEELDALEALSAAATPGPWRVVEANLPMRFTPISDGEHAFLTRAREAVPALIAALREARAERDAAFARGVAAMREAAAQCCEVSPIHGERTTTAQKYADAVRALPDPEDK